MSLVLLGGAVVVALVLVAVGSVAQVLATYLQAAAAADAAALAAAPVTFRPFGAGGTASEEAARFAAANGARLVACRCAPDASWEPRTVAVTVAKTVDLAAFGTRTVRASSRAEFVPAQLLNPDPR